MIAFWVMFSWVLHAMQYPIYFGLSLIPIVLFSVGMTLVPPFSKMSDPERPIIPTIFGFCFSLAHLICTILTVLPVDEKLAKQVREEPFYKAIFASLLGNALLFGSIALGIYVVTLLVSLPSRCAVWRQKMLEARARARWDMEKASQS